MRQNAVSSAPQNDAPTHSEETTATIPTVVEDCCRRRMPSVSVLGAGVGKIVRGSAITDAASSGDSSTRPATNSAISASGKIDSSRLYATIAARPVRPASYALRQNLATARAKRCTPPVYRARGFKPPEAPLWARRAPRRPRNDHRPRVDAAVTPGGAETEGRVPTPAH